MHTLSQYCTVAGALMRACHKTLWAGNPWEATPVINGVARQ